jgi:hypothetical protein
MTEASPRRDFPWEFGFVVDEERRDIGFAMIRGRLNVPGQMRQLAELRRDHRTVGMTCQGVFPMRGELPGNLPIGTSPGEGRHEAYLGSIDGWAHCFRHPDQYLPEGSPRIRYCDSDNVDPDRVWTVATQGERVTKRWDFIYTCMPVPSNIVAKNWELARRCAIRFATNLHLRGLLVGVAALADVPMHPLIEVRPFIRWTEFVRCLLESRVAFFPNTWDPSPRVIAEALSLDVPVLVNRNILGGWHYICDATGRFFEDEEGAVQIMDSTPWDALGPREWYCAHYGPWHAGVRLAEFITSLEPSVRLDAARPYWPRDHNGNLPARSSRLGVPRTG